MLEEHYFMIMQELVKNEVSRDVLECELTNLNYQKGTKERQESFEVLELRSYKVQKRNFSTNKCGAIK